MNQYIPYNTVCPTFVRGCTLHGTTETHQSIKSFQKAKNHNIIHAGDTRYTCSRRSLANLKDDSASHRINITHHIDTKGRSAPPSHHDTVRTFGKLQDCGKERKKESKANRFTNLVFGSDHIKRNALQQYYSQ